MKNKLIAAALLLFAAHTQTSAQMLVITNGDVSCPVHVTLSAHNSAGMYTSCNALHTSTTITIPAMSSVTYMDITDLNLAACGIPGSGPGWLAGGVSVCASSGGVWDQILINYGGGAALYDLSGCAGSNTSGTIKDCVGRTGTVSSGPGAIDIN